ncbi:MAG: exonuclease SbcCD subunit D [Candidatus Dependentiae bacterium]|nr:exonuclease SbcCD subunit D [Candidatus Dependentiae bacterium]
MIRFVHVADLHFGVENYGKIDPKTGIHTRLLDFKAALDQAIAHAITEQVDFFLFCGDAYKTPFPTPTQQRLLLDSFLALFRAQIPVVIIVGNHDNPASFGKTHALDIFGQLPVDGFIVVEKPRIIRLDTKHGPVQIVGIPWPNRSHLPLNNHVSSHPRELAGAISTRIAQIVRTCAEQLDPHEPSIFAAHLTVSNGLFSGSERRAIIGNDPVFLPSQLAIPPFDYVALGHLHRHQELRCGRTPIVYPGSIERIDFGELRDEKGFCIVEIEKREAGEKITNHRFVPIKTREFVEIEIRLVPDQDQTAQIITEIKRRNLQRDAIIKIIYRLPDGQPDRVDLRAVSNACAPAHDIAAIIPIRTLAPRMQRSFIATNTSLAHALTLYCSAKKISSAQQERIALLLHRLEDAHYVPSNVGTTEESCLQHHPPAPPSLRPDLLDG